jgi:hypothetical protein
VEFLQLSTGDSASSHVLTRVYGQKNDHIQVLFASSEQKLNEMLDSELSSDNMQLTLCGFDSAFLQKVASHPSKPSLVMFSRKAAPPTEDENALLLPVGVQDMQEEDEDLMEEEELHELPPNRDVEVSASSSNKQSGSS